MQLEGGKGSSLRMTLLQGLVKMTWSGSSREEQGASSRGLPPALGQTDSGAKSARPGAFFDTINNCCSYFIRTFCVDLCEA